MKLKTIFWIAAVLMLLQLLPLLGAMISPDFKAALIFDAFGVETLSPDGNLMFDTFALVLGCVALGIFFMMVGIIKRFSGSKTPFILLFVVMGFFDEPYQRICWKTNSTTSSHFTKPSGIGLIALWF